jgi:hypothetical protein
MRKILNGAALVIALASLAGCEFWFGDDDDCQYGGGGDDGFGYPFSGYRDPYTGQCFGGGGGGGGGGGCDVPYAADQAAEPESYDYAFCESGCEGLDEASCTATPACRAIYVSTCPPDAPCAPPVAYQYYDCWGTAPSGPIQGGDCTTFDAYECSMHDDCSARHALPYLLDGEGGGAEAPALYAPEIGNFESCIPEAPVPVESCTGTVTCEALPPECPAGTTPGISGDCWTWNCIPFASCDPPIDPGSCYEEAICFALPAECPAGSTPGVRDGCWTGYCIPFEQCEEPPTCEDYTDAASCANNGCTPIYQGDNCTCPDGTDPGGNPESSSCTCETWTFTYCSSLD